MIGVIGIRMVTIISMASISIRRMRVWPGIGYYHCSPAVIDVYILAIINIHVVPAYVGFITG
jgi:hypothetical protein